jgi:hypothetical protein
MAAVSAVSPIGPAMLHKFLPVKGYASIAAIACLGGDFNPVYE